MSERAGSVHLEREEQAPRPKAGGWMRGAQLAVGAIVLALCYWQLARVDFAWREALAGTSPWFFFLAMATLPVFGFPISACYIYAGLAFDPWTAGAACLGALAVNMSASYLLMRSFLRGPLMKLMARRGWKVPVLRGDNVFRFTFLIRTIPGPPFFFQNLALSLAGIPFLTYLWVSLLAQGTIAIGVIYCSHALSRNPSSVGGLIAVGLVVVVVIARVSLWLSRRWRRKRQAA